jgi:tetratricopeptide (TPR) repeat protein
MAVLRVRRTPETSLRAATAAANAGDHAAVFGLIPLSSAGHDSAAIATTRVPLHVQSLAALGRPADADALVQRFDRWLAPGLRAHLARVVAQGWIRAGALDRARATLSAAGTEADSTDAAGWIALYEGDIRSARKLLRHAPEGGRDIALALATVARIRSDSAPAVGRAFLALARGDSTSAATSFEAAAQETRECSSLLLLIAADLRSGLGDRSRAISHWKRIVDEMPETPEAPQADLSWARELRAAGDRAAAAARLEHLILTYPESALVPQARYELAHLRGVASR